MDRLQKNLHVIESMKKTMLMHEEIFKQQVRELHRLYNLQKKLMYELKNEATRTEVVKETDITDRAYRLRDDQRELSNCSEESSRMPLKFDLERPAEVGPSSTQVKNIDEETDVEVELTLSMGYCTKEKRSKHHLKQGDHDKLSGSTKLVYSSTKIGKGEEYGEPSSSMSSSSPSQNQVDMRPHWLLRDLSLNRT